MQTAQGAIVDFVLVGSSLKAGVIAGLLAKQHKKRVCLIIRGARQYQLARTFELSFDCATRPETWDMFSALDGESTKLVRAIGGRGCLARINPTIVCHTKASGNALAHMYHVARGHGYEMERLGDFKAFGAQAMFHLFGARMVRHNMFWPAMLVWLEKCGVQIIEPCHTRFSFHRDGAGRMINGQNEIEAGCVVLADEEAVLQHAGAKDIERFFITCRATSLLSAPLTSLSDQFILSPEHRFAAMGHKKGRMEFSALAGPKDMAALINANVPVTNNISRSGQTAFDTLFTRNGAPMAGKLGRSNFWVLSGFGHAGVHFAPALARLLVDKSSQKEKDYFEPRSANSTRQSKRVAFFQVMAKQVLNKGQQCQEGKKC